MKLIDYIILAVVVLILIAAGWFIRKAKKSGKKCIGCPDGGSCSGSCGSCNRGCNSKD